MPAAELPGGQILDTRAGRRGKNVKNRILVIEDEASISELICMNLEIGGYEARPLYTGREVLELLGAEGGAAGDLALVDVMLPDRDGFELMGALTASGIPVIYLTARGDLASKVRGLTLGAEDYIVKPFEIVELLARVDVVLRRYRLSEEEIHICGLDIDTRSMRVTRAGQEIALTKKEYELLLFFARNPNTALYRETIYERVWGGEFEYGSKTVDLHVQRLRKKVGWTRELQAVNKVGYRLEVKE